MTIYDIAREAGVSASTVSRVINKKSGVGEKTRLRIQALVDKENFILDENARNLVMQKTHTIGILTDDTHSLHPNLSLVNAQNAILRTGYYCFVKYIGKDDNALEDAIKDMAMKKVEGVMMMGVTFHNHELLSDLIKRYLQTVPVVLVHQINHPDLENVYAVGADEKKGIEKCVELLHERGRKNIGLMIDKDRASSLIIENAFLRAAGRYKDVTAYVYRDVQSSRNAGGETARKILKEHPDIDGLLCVNDMIAIGASYALQDLGKRIPEDISIIGEDNSELCEACKPRLTSLDPMLGVTPVFSAHILVDVLQGIHRNHSITVEVDVVNRETL